MDLMLSLVRLQPVAFFPTATEPISTDLLKLALDNQIPSCPPLASAVMLPDSFKLVALLVIKLPVVGVMEVKVGLEMLIFYVHYNEKRGNK